MKESRKITTYRKVESKVKHLQTTVLLSQMDTKIFKGRKSDKEILYMALIDVALRYEKESDRNDTKPYDDILEKLTSEIEDALK